MNLNFLLSLWEAEHLFLIVPSSRSATEAPGSSIYFLGPDLRGRGVGLGGGLRVIG